MRLQKRFGTRAATPPLHPSTPSPFAPLLFSLPYIVTACTRRGFVLSQKPLVTPHAIAACKSNRLRHYSGGGARSSSRICGLLWLHPLPVFAFGPYCLFATTHLHAGPFSMQVSSGLYVGDPDAQVHVYLHHVLELGEWVCVVRVSV